MCRASRETPIHQQRVVVATFHRCRAEPDNAKQQRAGGTRSTSLDDLSMTTTKKKTKKDLSFTQPPLDLRVSTPRRLEKQRPHLTQRRRNRTARTPAVNLPVAAAAGCLPPPPRSIRTASTPSPLQPGCCPWRPLAAVATPLGAAPSPPYHTAEGGARRRMGEWGMAGNAQVSSMQAGIPHRRAREKIQCTE